MKTFVIFNQETGEMTETFDKDYADYLKNNDHLAVYEKVPIVEYTQHILVSDGVSMVFRIAHDHALVNGARTTVENAREIWAALKKDGWMVP